MIRTPMHTTDRVLHKEIVVEASPAEVWQKWTTKEGLVTFFGADNDVELAIGGRFEIYFNMDEEYGKRGSEGCKILSFLPNQMLSFSWNAPPEIPKVRNHEHKAWVVIIFREIESGLVHVDLKHFGWLPGEEWDQTYSYFDKAWAYVLKGLRDSLDSQYS